MKPFLIALLGTAALATPGVAFAQTTNGQAASETTPALDCPPVPSATSTATPTASASGTPATDATPTPSASATPGSGDSTGTPDVSGLGNGGTTSTPGTGDTTGTPDVSGFGSGGGTTTSRYVTNPDITRMTSSVERDDLGVRTIYKTAGYTSGYSPVDVATRNTYSTPTNGLIRTIGGQPIAVASSSVGTNFQPRIVNIIDELVLVARAVGVHDPVITSGTDGTHTATSIHGLGLAVDLRANDLSAAQAKAYVIALKNALGPGYDVLYEDWHGSNTHIHVEYDGHTA